MNTDYSAPDIDTTQAQRQAAEAQESFVSFSSIRAVAGSADASFGFGTRASRPASGVQGDRYYATDIGAIGGWLYYWTGTGWEILTGWASGTNAVRAALTVTAVDNGAWFNATDTSKFWEVSGGAWVDRTPAAGTVTSFSATPTGIFDVATATTTPSLSLDTQAPNTALMGPASGGAAIPGFRVPVTADLPSDEYSTWTPTVTAGSGTFTTVSASGRYKRILGKTIVFSLRITITTNNTAAGYVQTALPVACANIGWYQQAVGAETSVTSKQLKVNLQSNSTNMFITNYDGTYPGGSGYTLDISGMYEIA